MYIHDCMCVSRLPSSTAKLLFVRWDTEHLEYFTNTTDKQLSEKLVEHFRDQLEEQLRDQLKKQFKE